MFIDMRNSLLHPSSINMVVWLHALDVVAAMHSLRNTCFLAALVSTNNPMHPATITTLINQYNYELDLHKQHY